VEQFLSKHAQAVIGTLSGFDRLVFRGTLRFLAHHTGMVGYLWSMGVRLQEFAAHAEALTGRLREASEALARRTNRPIRYLASSATSKEDIAREIAAADGIKQGLICILTAVEPCLSFEVVRDRTAKQVRIEPRQRKCLFLYHYRIHPVFGFMHARIQTWLPFSIQICLNGRIWLARQMAAADLEYVQRDNCFTWLQDPKQAQQLMNEQMRVAWPELLTAIARELNPLHEDMFRIWPIDYYWSTYQSEWATDIMFRDAGSLARLYPKLVLHGLTTFLSPDVMRFLGRKIPPSGNLPPGFLAEVTSDMKKRPEGVRIKHRLGENSIKMYDKQGSVLRVETTLSDVSDFRTFRTPEGKPEAEKRWLPMRKGIADLHLGVSARSRAVNETPDRRAEVSQAANARYLTALASVENPTPLGRLTARLAQPAQRNGRRVRALNPHAPADAKLFEAIGRGEFTLNGFRNRDLRALLFADTDAAKPDQRRHAAVVSRQIALLRTHGLIKKVQGTHRYHLTKEGRVIVTALISIRNVGMDVLTKLAA
jgi:hypothetical protein